MFTIALLALAQTASAQPAPVPPTASAAPAAQRMRCVRVAETGSLAKSTKVCKSVADWEEQRRNAQTQTHDMQDPSSGSGAGPTG